MAELSTASGCLFVVATPIGNCDDWSPRALSILEGCQGIACEDTRVTGKLLDRFKLHLPLLSYRDDNERAQTQTVIRGLQGGQNWALLCDAGTPTISDPGFRVVRECRRLGIPVCPIPGPCALITALCASGLPSDGFLFLGFLPNRSAPRQKILADYAEFAYTVIFYESCHRIEQALADIVQVSGAERVITVARELTKLHETFAVGPAAEVREAVSKQAIRGEYVILIAPRRFQL